MTGRQRRRIERLYRKIVALGSIYVSRGRDQRRWGCTGRDIARLEAQGRVVVKVTKRNLFGNAFGLAREIEVTVK